MIPGKYGKGNVWGGDDFGCAITVYSHVLENSTPSCSVISSKSFLPPTYYKQDQPNGPGSPGSKQARDKSAFVDATTPSVHR
ncbi:hypothetical protein CEXT_215861 [Caerostris extrusa]|uniref:Uncharacterized protein n=1 Tax=Caerostris extrusa TaxID=172846 RepID=A0AAV4QE18_CAEEX|nr:hypothetical protein CEXT_215861 [Caerostris extrusa]